MSRDLYSRLHEIDDPTLESIADVLELRGRHSQQVAIRARYLDLLPAATWRGARVLDVGCGTGVVTRDIAARIEDAGHVVGSDPTPAFVRRARALQIDAGLTNVEHTVGDGRQLEYPDGTFDVVTAVTVLCHLPERLDVLREMARVVKAGGAALIVDGEYAANQVEHPDRALTERIVAAWRASVVDDPLLMRRIVPMVEQAGLTVERLDGHLHVEAGRVEPARSFIWQWAEFAVRQARAADAISEAEGARWLADLGRLNDAAALFGSVTYVSVLARRR